MILLFFYTFSSSFNKDVFFAEATLLLFICSLQEFYDVTHQFLNQLHGMCVVWNNLGANTQIPTYCLILHYKHFIGLKL